VGLGCEEFHYSQIDAPQMCSGRLEIVSLYLRPLKMKGICCKRRDGVWMWHSGN
jgi:hypothetical protein